VLGFTYKFNEKYFKNAKLWKQALEKKDFVAADKIRDELMKEEII
jgi:cysteinyl-tRNA synthetase